MSRRFLLVVAVACWVGCVLATAEAQVPPPAADVAPASEVLEPETPSPWTIGLLTSTIALTLGGVSSVLGIWVRRDQKRPAINAIAMTALVIAAVSVGLAQGYLDAVGSIRHAQDLERMLTMVDEIALESGDPALAELVRSERGPAGVAPPAGQ